MISTNTVYTAVQSVLNKDNRGLLRPEDYNNYSRVALFNLFEQIKDENATLISGSIKAKNNINATRQSSEALSDLFKPATLTLTNGKYPKPADLDFMDGLYVGDIRITQVDIKTQKLLYVISNMSPTNDTPVYVEYEDGYEVFSESISEDITLYYYRIPKTPRWTYLETAGSIVYDGSNGSLQDFELPEYYFSQLVQDILFLAGMNIRDMEVLKTMIAKDNAEELIAYRDKILKR